MQCWIMTCNNRSPVSLPHSAARCATADEKYDSLFDALDKGSKGGLKKGELAQSIRDQNEEYWFLDDSDFGPFVKQAWADAHPDEEGLVRFDQFAEWYDTLLAHIKSIKQAQANADAATKEAAVAEAASMFSGDGCDTTLPCHNTSPVVPAHLLTSYAVSA